MVIKAVLGWFSFISMLTSRRHQAVHDWLTRSTVQLRDPSRASSQDYVRERRELSLPGMPSRVRRVLVIGAYLLVTLLAFGLVQHVLVSSGLLSDACLLGKRCTAGEYTLNLVFGVALIAAFLFLVGYGWRGRLPGCRMRAELP
jgi:hypothetical protein